MDRNQSFLLPFSDSTNTSATDEHKNSENKNAFQQKKQRKARTAFSDHQLQTLENNFERQKYLSVQDRMELAAKLNLTDTQVKTWYQNRRWVSSFLNKKKPVIVSKKMSFLFSVFFLAKGSITNLPFFLFLVPNGNGKQRWVLSCWPKPGTWRRSRTCAGGSVGSPGRRRRTRLRRRLQRVYFLLRRCNNTSICTTDKPPPHKLPSKPFNNADVRPVPRQERRLRRHYLLPHPSSHPTHQVRPESGQSLPRHRRSRFQFRPLPSSHLPWDRSAP